MAELQFICINIDKSTKYNKPKKVSVGWGYSSEVKHLPSVPMALGSTLSSTHMHTKITKS